MDNSESTTRVKGAGRPCLTEQESDLVEKAKSKKITGFTFTIPATFLARCYVCQAVIAEVVLVNASWPTDVDIEIEQGAPRANLASPHACTERPGDAQ